MRRSRVLSQDHPLEGRGRKKCISESFRIAEPRPVTPIGTYVFQDSRTKEAHKPSLAEGVMTVMIFIGKRSTSLLEDLGGSALS